MLLFSFEVFGVFVSVFFFSFLSIISLVGTSESNGVGLEKCHSNNKLVIDMRLERKLYSNWKTSIFAHYTILENCGKRDG